ncbi:hypothetical protein K461DRAFT_323934 [Myriangium duriaei CBS 260.36]|uniref:Uncharacterized protein n=1 Tax=Myriangium duriaei CBS 260.36 TaxID=1168546 RepID=A0A9P4IVB2_9PEZI|nr:hypothetical protein K461DRAFT_323934 [Myriangium duriaei CBS 260.36]
MPLAQTVTVVNRSGKVVKTSKHLVNVFKDAKTAYLERKAEIKAVRKADLNEKEARRARERLEVDDSEWDRSSRASSRRSSYQSDSTARPRRTHSDRPRDERRHSGDSVRSGRSNPTSPRSPRSPRPHGQSRLRFEDVLSETNRESAGRELVRRNTDGILGEQRVSSPVSPKSTRSASLDDLDMSLAYGELPPPLPLRPKTREETDELRNKVSRLQTLLDEANCAQYSVVTMIENLQKNPDQLAAVALTLAEISNLASKMAPAALTSMKGIFPAVFALLASPEFMIAAGVGVGVTVIALGGYKIIKRIRNKKDADKEAIEGEPSDADELQEIRSDLSRIEVWRRGIADAQADSTATSVDGEFITPIASKQLIDEGRMRQSDLKSTKSVKSSKSKKTSKDKEKDKRKREKERKRRDSHGDDESVFDKGKALIRDPNGIRSLFKKDSRKPEPSIA